MPKSNGLFPKPRRRLLRTFFRRPRDLRRFAPRVSFETTIARMPDPGELSHWGQVVLLSDSVVALHRDGTVSRLFHLITALHGDRDLAEWDELTRDYNRRNSLETIRKATVYLPDGTKREATKTVTPLDPYTRIISLTFHPLRPGVIVEFEEQYDHFEPLEIGPGLWDHMFLQGPAPCRQVRCTVAVADPFDIEYRLHHSAELPQESHDGEYRVLQWNREDVPGIETDDWTPSPRDFVPWVDVSSFSSWQPIARHYQKELAPNSVTPKEVQTLVRELTTDAQTPRDQISAIYRYAARDVRYGRHPSELTLEAPREAGKMLEDLRGDCKDKSALMISMLRELNIPAQIGLVLTRMNGTAPFLPGPRFDHAVVRTELDGQELWLDPAGGPCTFGDLPYNDQGIPALILENGAETILTEIPAPTPVQHKIERHCRGQLQADGTYRFDVEFIASGEQAVLLRMTYQDRLEEHRNRMLAQTISADLIGADVSEVRFLELEDLRHPVRYRCTITLKAWARTIQDIILFHIPWFDPIQMNGPVCASTRLQPLSAPGPLGIRERHEIELPAGFASYGLPYEIDENCQWSRYHLRILEDEGRLIGERHIDHLGGLVLPDQFADFKRYWEQAARADRSDIVLLNQSGQQRVPGAGR